MMNAFWELAKAAPSAALQGAVGATPAGLAVQALTVAGVAAAGAFVQHTSAEMSEYYKFLAETEANAGELDVENSVFSTDDYIKLTVPGVGRCLFSPRELGTVLGVVEIQFANLINRVGNKMANVPMTVDVLTKLRGSGWAVVLRSPEVSPLVQGARHRYVRVFGEGE